jgi:hypothetical protein
MEDVMMGQYLNPEWEILEAMEKYGGNFIQQLARLYRAADMENKRKLTSTFENYFQKYDEVATQVHKNANT